MKWSITYLEEYKIILIRTEGLWDKESSSQIMKESHELSSKVETKNFLVDNSELIPSYRIIDVYMVGEQIYKNAVLITKIALINSKLADKNDEKLTFFKTVTDNRGINLEYFSTFEEAVKWLTLDD
jgi:hypothetical protein